MDHALKNTTLGEVLVACVDDAKQVWLGRHQAGRDADHAWTLDTVETDLDVVFKHNGRAVATVSVIAKQPWKCYVDVFHLTRLNRGDWIRTDSSIARKRKLNRR